MCLFRAGFVLAENASLPGASWDPYSYSWLHTISMMIDTDFKHNTVFLNR